MFLNKTEGKINNRCSC